MDSMMEKIVQLLETISNEGKWFDIPQCDYKVYVTIITVTPELAKRLIELNVKNRPLSKPFVNRYARTMKQDGWKFNADSLRFSNEGLCIDGQHRLYACIESNVSFVTMVCVNLPKETYAIVDQGRSRTLPQMLAKEEVENHGTVSALIKAYVTLDDGRVVIDRNRGTFSYSRSHENYELLSIYYQNKEMFDKYSKRAIELCGAIKRHPINGNVAAAYWMYLVKNLGYDDAFVEKFFRMIYSNDTAENHNVNLLRIKFLDMRAGLSTHQTKARQKYMATASYKRNLLAHTWNLYATNHEDIEKLTFPVRKSDIELLSKEQADKIITK